MLRFRAIPARLKTHTFSALIQHPNYRLYWAGALTSNIGTWVQMVAQGWLVYELTRSALYLGMVGFALAIPSLFLSLVGGVLADRFERRRLMIGTQTAAMILAFLLAGLTLTGIVAVWHIIVIAFLAGVVNALNTPVRQAIISDLVPREALMNAISLNSAQFQSSRTLGPALAGVLILAVGPGWCFFINGLSFFAVIVVLAVMKLPPVLPLARETAMADNLAKGFAYVRGEPVILSLIALAVVPSFFGMPYIQLMPAFAASVYGVGPEGLGLLTSAAGLGALVGALLVASLGVGARRGMLMLVAVAGFGLCLSIFALSASFALSIVALVGVGGTGMAFNALNQTFLQTMADPAMRGRVMSLLTVTTFGMQPLGSLGAGVVASAFGPQLAVLVGGTICVLFAFWILLTRPAIRSLS